MPRPKELQPIQIKGILEADIERLEKQKEALEDVIDELSQKCEEAYAKRQQIAYAIEKELEDAKRDRKKAQEDRAEVEGQLKIKQEVAVLQGLLARDKEAFKAERKAVQALEEKVKTELQDLENRKLAIKKAEDDIEKKREALTIQEGTVILKRSEVEQIRAKSEEELAKIDSLRCELNQEREAVKAQADLLVGRKREFELKIKEIEASVKNDRDSLTAEFEMRKKALDKKEADLVRREVELNRNYEDYKVRIDQLTIREAKAKK